MSKSTIQQLRRAELFASCPRSALVKIDQLATHVRLRGGRSVCVEGSVGAEFFVLLDGIAAVHTSAGTNAVLHPGAWFGEIALLRRGTRTATVTTLTDAEVLVFNRREFATLLVTSPAVRREIWLSSRRVLAGAAPTSRPWYQPTDAERCPQVTNVLA
jgi:CRP/FNR family cyclic AMP-dependent transcriptional regulator